MNKINQFFATHGSKVIAVLLVLAIRPVDIPVNAAVPKP